MAEFIKAKAALTYLIRHIKAVLVKKT